MKRQGRKAAFLNLGCKVNAYETEAMMRLFREAGYEITGFGEEADIYVVNTCTVTNMADRKSRQMLHRARKKNPGAVIAAAGCYVQAAGEALLEDGSVDVLVGNNEKHRIVELVEAYLQDRGKNISSVGVMEGALSYEPLSAEGAGEKTRAFLKIQDGCNQFCSYCIIPYVRGRIRSREPEEVVREAGQLAGAGYREIVLTGIHLSSYGVKGPDFTAQQGRPLLSLLKELDEIEGIQRIRLGSLEPRIITEEFAEELSDIGKLCPHFHLSLQSGCDATLSRMNRHYTTSQYLTSVGILRSRFENPAFTTDIIVGFPGETAEEFLKTQDFLSRVGFADIHVFKYSRRSGTKADQMEPQVPEETKSRRSSLLLKLGERLGKRYRRDFLGRMQQLLLEDEMEWEGQTYFTGHNERYVKLAVRKEEFPDARGGELLEAGAIRELGDGVLLCRSRSDAGLQG